MPCHLSPHKLVLGCEPGDTRRNWGWPSLVYRSLGVGAEFRKGDVNQEQREAPFPV